MAGDFGASSPSPTYHNHWSDEMSKVPGFKSVELIGDCGTFTLKYFPDVPHGKPQTVMLEAEDEDNALLEAANMLECDEKLLTVEWC